MLGAADGLGKTTRACAGHLMLGGRGRIPEAEVDELEVGDSLVETLKGAPPDPRTPGAVCVWVEVGRA